MSDAFKRRRNVRVYIHVKVVQNTEGLSICLLKIFNTSNDTMDILNIKDNMNIINILNIKNTTYNMNNKYKRYKLNKKYIPQCRSE